MVPNEIKSLPLANTKRVGIWSEGPFNPAKYWSPWIFVGARSEWNTDIWEIFEAIIFSAIFLQNAIAAELAASQMISVPCLPIQQQIAYFLRHTYTGHTHDNLPLLLNY